MEVLAAGWQFVQNQVLGMKWLEGLIGRGLESLGGSDHPMGRKPAIFLL